MPSFRIISLPLEGTDPIPYSVASKTTVDHRGRTVSVYKFERNSDDKPSEGISFAMDAEDTFASMKHLDGDADMETPSTSKELQSKHWKMQKATTT